jgi:subtilisin family serine protease
MNKPYVSWTRAIVLVVIFIIFVFLTSGPITIYDPRSSNGRSGRTDDLLVQVIPGDLIVQFKLGTTEYQKQTIRNKIGGRLKEHVEVADSKGTHSDGDDDIELIDVSDTLRDRGASPADRYALQALANTIGSDPVVDFAEPNYVLSLASSEQPVDRPQYFSNDPEYLNGHLWGIYGDTEPKRKRVPRSGGSESVHAPLPPARHVTTVPASTGNATLAGGLPRSTHVPTRSRQSVKAASHGRTNPYGIQASHAWAQGHIGSRDIYVGIVDSGVQIDHPDLKANIWAKTGYDFLHKRPAVVDQSDGPHGTHIAGIIGAVGGNGAGIAGVVWRVSMIVAQFAGSKAGSTADAVKAFRYITDRKLKDKLNVVAINASWASYGFSKALSRAVKRAGRAGILCIAAADNKTLNNDVWKAYPASFDTRSGEDGIPGLAYDSVISVAALGRDGKLTALSNFGPSTVHIAAPGLGIVSTVPGSSYGTMDGTSMASAYVTGAVVLYASTHPKATPNQIRQAVLLSAKKLPALANKVATGGTLSVARF